MRFRGLTETPNTLQRNLPHPDTQPGSQDPHSPIPQSAQQPVACLRSIGLKTWTPGPPDDTAAEVHIPEDSYSYDELLQFVTAEILFPSTIAEPSMLQKEGVIPYL